MRVCPKCQSERLVKNSSAAGKAKKQWKQCGDQFTCTTPRGKPRITKINAVLLSLSGLSMHRIAFLCDFNHNVANFEAYPDSALNVFPCSQPPRLETVSPITWQRVRQ